MPYAVDDMISKAPLAGGIEISDQEYNQARRHLLLGRLVKVHAGQMFLTEKPDTLPDHEEPVWQDGDWYHAPIEEEPKTIEQLADDKRRELDRARDDAFATGTEFAFPGGQMDQIQIRPEDRSNLLAIAMEARDLQAAGETQAVIDFRAGSNVTYELTPEQAISMTTAALAHVKAIYRRSWQLKDSVDAALQAGDRRAIDAVSW